MGGLDLVYLSAKKSPKTSLYDVGAGAEQERWEGDGGNAQHVVDESEREVDEAEEGYSYEGLPWLLENLVDQVKVPEPLVLVQVLVDLPNYHALHEEAGGHEAQEAAQHRANEHDGRRDQEPFPLVPGHLGIGVAYSQMELSGGQQKGNANAVESNYDAAGGAGIVPDPLDEEPEGVLDLLQVNDDDGHESHEEDATEDLGQPSHPGLLLLVHGLVLYRGDEATPLDRAMD
mmetsp:Transcript_11206/g.18851  ORF Transcript_11206/g.18851 Transcript_11206/m.18851 type:complete len:231 (-) Transcript_11206:140-832(-)